MEPGACDGLPYPSPTTFCCTYTLIGYLLGQLLWGQRRGLSYSLLHPPCHTGWGIEQVSMNIYWMNIFIHDISKVSWTASIRTFKRVTQKRPIPEPGGCRELLKYTQNRASFASFLIFNKGGSYTSPGQPPTAGSPLHYPVWTISLLGNSGPRNSGDSPQPYLRVLKTWLFWVLASKCQMCSK